jgi:hypothetical protein
MNVRNWMVTLGIAGAAAGTAFAAHNGLNFGLYRDGLLDAHSVQVFGVVKPVEASSRESIDATEANTHPTHLVAVAKGLQARVVSANPNLGANIDMMLLWPNDVDPSHIIACNEGGVGDPGVQRIRVSDGAVETILTGTNSCDPVRRTAWGTVIVGEEAGATGQVIEVFNPLQTTNVSFNRATGVASGGVGAGNVVTRWALGRLSFEGLALYPNGVMYYGDEKRPGTNGAPGGAYFKFIPTTPWNGTTPVTSPSQSPIASGQVFGLRLGKRSGNTDNGQGTLAVLGTWVPVTPNNGNNVNLGHFAATNFLTHYYRPEDLDIDQAELRAGNVRFCGNNTGNEGDDRYFGETICITDGTLAAATLNTTTPELQFLVIGNPEFAMMDNIAYQPGRGNWIIHEDGDGPSVGRNNDLWACLDDGDDDDLLSDGCIRVGTLNDLTAEWTGGLFDASGTHFVVSVQHNISGHGVILDITGWR